jgi:hypothetical protein
MARTGGVIILLSVAALAHSEEMRIPFQASALTPVEIGEAICRGNHPTLKQCVPLDWCSSKSFEIGEFPGQSRRLEASPAPLFLSATVATETKESEDEDTATTATGDEPKKKKKRRPKKKNKNPEFMSDAARARLMQEHMENLALGRLPNQMGKKTSEEACAKLSSALSGIQDTDGVAAKDSSKQWTALIGDGEKKVRCGECTRPLSEEDKAAKRMMCSRCFVKYQSGELDHALEQPQRHQWRLTDWGSQLQGCTGLVASGSIMLALISLKRLRGFQTNMLETQRPLLHTNA